MRPLVDGNALAEKLLGLDALRVVEVMETPDELTVTVDTTADSHSVGRTH